MYGSTTKGSDESVYRFLSMLSIRFRNAFCVVEGKKMRRVKVIFLKGRKRKTFQFKYRFRRCFPVLRKKP